MKAILLLLFTVFFFALHSSSLAQAPAEESKQEQPPTEQAPVEESTKDEPPVDEAPAEEDKKGKRKNKKSKKEKAPVEESAVEESPSEKAPKEKKKGRRNKKNETPPEETPSETPAENGAVEETPTEETAPTPYKDDKKKDTWFRVFKMKRCPIKSCETKMVHIHNGKKYRGRKKLKFIQSPKTGELQRVPVTDPGKRKKSPKVKKDHEYQKEFKLPDKPIEPRGK